MTLDEEQSEEDGEKLTEAPAPTDAQSQSAEDEADRVPGTSSEATKSTDKAEPGGPVEPSSAPEPPAAPDRDSTEPLSEESAAPSADETATQSAVRAPDSSPPDTPENQLHPTRSPTAEKRMPDGN